jgi:hypothetical protein
MSFEIRLPQTARTECDNSPCVTPRVTVFLITFIIALIMHQILWLIKF